MYDLHSPFDIEQHKQHYIHYFEVVLFPDGHIEYAVPSHQEKLIQVCQDKLGISRYQLEKMCPKEYYCDYITWLCNISECVSIWEHYIVCSDKIPLTDPQKDMIERLQKEGLLYLR
jgi:hypothetical protein